MRNYDRDRDLDYIIRHEAWKRRFEALGGLLIFLIVVGLIITVTFFNDPGNKLRIDQLWTFVSQDEQGNEGLCVFHSDTTEGDGAFFEVESTISQSQNSSVTS